jgi:hypothetical protein
MPTFKLNFFSIVLVGRQNPQILNHDFLINNQVIPISKEPFKTLIKKSSKDNPPFTQYLSTPVVTQLAYNWISIIVQESRFQIIDNKVSAPSKSPIISFTKKYFGEILRYTPFQLGGLNFNGELKFSNKSDENNFDKMLGINIEKFKSNFNIKNQIQFESKINFPLDNGQGQINVSKPKKMQNIGIANFNFEFGYEDIDSFMTRLDEAERFFEFFKEMLVKLKVKVIK